MQTGYKEVRFKVSKLMYSQLKRVARLRGSTMTEVMKESLRRFIVEYDKANMKI